MGSVTRYPIVYPDGNFTDGCGPNLSLEDWLRQKPRVELIDWVSQRQREQAIHHENMRYFRDEGSNDDGWQTQRVQFWADMALSSYESASRGLEVILHG